MRMGAQDTHPEIERVQIEMLRKAGPTERVRLARSLSQSVMQMSWRAIQRANPEATYDEIELLFVTMNYGEDLANRLKVYLAGRKIEEQ